MNNTHRILWLDLIRIIACFMVIMIHVRLGFDITTDKAVQFYCALLRPCVPLFIMISGALLLPVPRDTSNFFKRRFSRVLIPFLIWSLLYAFFPTPYKVTFEGIHNIITDSHLPPILKSLLMIPANFTWANVHFWFMYVIIGLYLFMPVISPWIFISSEKNIRFFLILWGSTLFLPYFKLWFPQLHGICDWNEFGMLYNFGGYLGYLILGYYLKSYNSLSQKKNLFIAIPLAIAGFYGTYQGLVYSIDTKDNIEFFINNLTINVALFTTALFMILQKVSIPARLSPIVTELSNLSYGIFLIHYIICIWILFWANNKISTISTWIYQPLLTIIVFIVSYIIIKLISKLPKSNYLIG